MYKIIEFSLRSMTYFQFILLIIIFPSFWVISFFHKASGLASVWVFVCIKFKIKLLEIWFNFWWNLIENYLREFDGRFHQKLKKKSSKIPKKFIENSKKNSSKILNQFLMTQPIPINLLIIWLIHNQCHKSHHNFLSFYLNHSKQ